MSGHRPPVRVLDLEGSPQALGAAHGSAFADDIGRYAHDRVQLVASGLWSGGPIAQADVLILAESMLNAHAGFDLALHTEMLAMADAAGISPAEAVIVGGFTDFVDTVRAEVGGAPPPTLTEDDCTAVLVPDDRAEGSGFLAQTWDMHDTATDYVVLLRIKPDDGPSARVFTTTGCLGQIGMNELGLCVGINNLTGADGRPGVTWPSVVRAMLRCQTADEARDVLLGADLAGAHNYLILDANGVGYNIEAMPTARPVTPLYDEPLVHTNHTLHPDATKFQAPRASALTANSVTRREHAIELLAEGPIDAERLFALTRDERAICQSATDPYHIESSGAVVMQPGQARFWACWGRPAENQFEIIGPEGPPTLNLGDDFSPIHVGQRSGLRYTPIRDQWSEELAALELASYPSADPDDLYDAPSLALLAADFSEGCFAGFDGDRLVAMGLGIRVDFDLDNPQHHISEIVPDDHASTGHDPSGQWYYGTGISTRPEYRRRGIGSELYHLRKQVCQELNLRGIVAGGVIPGYADHKHHLTADDYIAEVKAGRLYDPTLTFQLQNGFDAVCALADYITDPSVDSWAALIVWHNPAYR